MKQGVDVSPVESTFNIGDGARLVLFVLSLWCVSGVAEATPIANFAANPNPAAPGQAVFFDGTASYDTDPTLSIVSYLWDLGDGTTASGATVAHAYSLFGAYWATLTVTNNHAPAETNVGGRSVVVSQGNMAPVANAGGPYSVSVGNSLHLDGGGSSDPNAAAGDLIVAYLWDLNNDGGYGDASGVSPVISFATLASFGQTAIGPLYPVRLEVVDSFGAVAYHSSYYQVTAAVPEASSVVVLALGLAGLAGITRRGRK